MAIKQQIPLAGPANRQGHIAAKNMMGQKEEISGNTGYISGKSIRFNGGFNRKQ